jgi:hypothetical protein
MYDGTIIRVDFNNSWQVVVQDPSTVANKVALGGVNRNYNPDL